MVSLRHREFIGSLSNDPVVRGLAALLLSGAALPSPVPRQNDRQRITLLTLQALGNGDSGGFRTVYEDIQRRRLSEDADWIFDNYLLFVLACAAVRFNANRRFLLDVLGQRRSIQPSADDSIGRALESFLADPKAATEIPLIFVAKHVSQSGPYDESSIRRTYRHAVRILESSGESEFNRLIAVAAVDLAFDCSALSDTPASRFVQTMRARVQRIAAGAYWTLLLFVTGGWGFLAYRYFAAEDAFSRNIEKVFTVGLTITPVAAFLARKTLTQVIAAALLRALGIPPQRAGVDNQDRP